MSRSLTQRAPTLPGLTPLPEVREYRLTVRRNSHSYQGAYPTGSRYAAWAATRPARAGENEGMATHEVVNQAPPRVDVDEFGSNVGLVEGVARYDAEWAVDDLS